jgi:hypothetical protein
MSFLESIVEKNPSDYSNLIESRVLDKVLQMKLSTYNSLQKELFELIPGSNICTYATEASDIDTGSWNSALTLQENIDFQKEKCTSQGGCFNPKVTVDDAIGKPWCLKPVLGGARGKVISKQMIDLQNEIRELIDEQKEESVGFLKTNTLLSQEQIKASKDLESLLEKLAVDRLNINKFIDEPQASALADDGYSRQLSNYVVYALWCIIAIISIFLSIHLITTDSISAITYVFVGIWVFILVKYYYQQVKYYGGAAVNSVSNLLVDNI